MTKKRAHRRFRLFSCVTDFAVRRNTPDNTKLRTNCAEIILRVTDSGCPDQRTNATTKRIKKDAKIMAKALIAVLWLGGAGGAGISSNITISVYTRDEVQLRVSLGVVCVQNALDVATGPLRSLRGQ